LNPEFSYLCEILTAEESSSTEEWTLFAPPDSAFDAIGDTLEGLSDKQLVDIILYHGTDGDVSSDDLECSETLVMFNGRPSRTMCKKNSDGEDIIIQKGSGNRMNDILPVIVIPNIAACNGMIHIIDQVMLPNFINKFDIVFTEDSALP
jgi:uncharacterized surface protein with fasciclin (FAS1) repeats